MPAPIQPATDPRQTRPILGHVNLMVDTFLANASADDLRAIVRGLLSSGSPAITTAFLGAAQRRLVQANVGSVSAYDDLFVYKTDDATVLPTMGLMEALRKARTLYGAGLGFASLEILARPVRATAEFHWRDNVALERAFAEIDADICQALQSSREELESGRLEDLPMARGALEELKDAIRNSRQAVESWNGMFPFDRAAASLEFWKL